MSQSTTPSSEKKSVPTSFAPSPVQKTHGHSTPDGYCHARDCKKPEARFSFCGEHYDQFKFGLIKRTGEAVPDYDKKLEHYQAFVARQKTQKAA